MKTYKSFLPVLIFLNVMPCAFSLPVLLVYNYEGWVVPGDLKAVPLPDAVRILKEQGAAEVQIESLRVMTNKDVSIIRGEFEVAGIKVFGMVVPTSKGRHDVATGELVTARAEPKAPSHDK